MNDEMYELLFRAVQEGTVAAVQKAASRIFGSAVSVTDTSFRVLSADEDPGSTDDMLDKKGDQIYVSGELLDLFRKHNLISSMIENPHTTIVVDWGYFEDHPHLTTGIFSGKNILGVLTVLVDDCVCTPEQDEALQACADALALVLRASESGKIQLGTQREHFISKLFHGSATARDLENAERNRYFYPAARYVVLAAELPPQLILNRVDETRSRMLLYQDEGITYLLANAQNKDLQALKAWIADRGHRYGLSYPFHDLLLAGKMAEHAAAALRYGNLSGVNKADWVFSECALEMLTRGVPVSVDFTHPGVFEMRQYDLQNNTQYVETLRMWLLNRMDYSETAKAMNLHRNSLYYRLQRIRDLFDLDLEDMNTDVQLYLCLCAE